MYSVEDVQVLSLVARMRTDKFGFDEIYAALEQGQRGDAPAIPPSDSMAMSLSREGREFLEGMNDTLENLLDRVESLEKADTNRDRTELQEARIEIRRLEREIGKLQARLEIERELRQKDDN